MKEKRDNKIKLVLLGKITINYIKKKQTNKYNNIFRIKIEPHKGIPTRFLGPTALPESLADMLVKQVC